ncbi:MAG TPA: hypothetical protein VFP00_10115 [Burkholderiales bacterium]|nr:hypothetical protein [Burkholderiales bacterium]
MIIFPALTALGVADPREKEVLCYSLQPNPTEEDRRQMAKPNYAFAKRQRDLAKKQKKEEKRQRKTEAQRSQSQEDPRQPPADDTSTPSA